MNKRKLATVVFIIVTVVMTAKTLPQAFAQTEAEAEHHEHMDNMRQPMTVKTLTLEMIHSRELPLSILSIDKAIKAIESGDKKTALTELLKAQKTLVAIHRTLGKHAQPQFVNNRCPIMGSPINPEKVTNDLIREYKNQKVAFCCAGCPSTWDELTDTEKNAKLVKVQPALQQVWTCSMHPQIKQSKSGSCQLCNMKLIPVSTQ